MAKRAGRTVKLSVSLDAEHHALLEKRAKRLAGGNVSAAIAEALDLAAEWDGRKALAQWLGAPHGEPTREELDAVRAEWKGVKPKRRTRAA